MTLVFLLCSYFFVHLSHTSLLVFFHSFLLFFSWLQTISGLYRIQPHNTTVTSATTTVQAWMTLSHADRGGKGNNSECPALLGLCRVCCLACMAPKVHIHMYISSIPPICANSRARLPEFAPQFYSHVSTVTPQIYSHASTLQNLLACE